MKHIYLVGTAIAIVASIASCSRKELDVLPESKTVTTYFTAHSADTRTVFGAKEDGAYPILWTTNKDVKVVFTYYALDKNNNLVLKDSPKDATVKVTDGGKEASFSVQYTVTDDMQGDYNYLAVSPSDAYVGYSESNGLNVNISDSQTPLSNSVDEGAQILIAKEGPVEEVMTNIDFEFEHATAYAKMTLTNLSIPSGATVTNYTVTAEDIAGRWYFNNGAMTKNSAKNTITIDPTNVENGVVWIALAPVDLRGKTFKIAVNTSVGPIEKEITFPASGNAGKFQSGHVSPFTINMNGITPGEKVEYTLVKSVADLTLDSEIIIAASAYNFALSTTQNSNNRAGTAVTKSDDNNTIVDPSDAVQVFKIANGYKGGRYAFYYLDGENVPNYIYAASSSANYLRTTTELDGNSSWNITINSESGVASIVADGSYTRNTLQYNSDSQLFACYGSASQKPVAIYKKAGTGSGAINPKVEYSISVSSSITNGSVTVSSTKAEPGDKITLTPNPNDGYELEAWDVKETVSGNIVSVATDNTFTMPSADVTVSASFSQAQVVTGTTVSLSGADLGSASTTPTEMDNEISFVNSAGNSYSNPMRIYANNTFTITAKTKNIIKVVFTCNSSSYASALSNATVTLNSGATSTCKVSDNIVTYTITGETKSFAVKPSAQVRLDGLAVTYN